MAFKVYTISYDYDYDTEEESSCYAVQNGSFPDLELAIAVATTMAEHLALPRNVGRRGRVVGRVVEVAWTIVCDDHEHHWTSLDYLEN
jgi:hypothetical protein